MSPAASSPLSFVSFYSGREKGHYRYSKYNTYIELYEAINTQYWLAQIKRFYDETIPLKERLFENSILSLENPIWRNAYYERYTNMFVILMPNFCDPMLNENYADAYNYAALGTVIGHELCHGFDAVGAKYNENGEKKEWWTVSDKLHYEDKKLQMKQLFCMFTLESDSTINVNGELTLGENLADLGGIATVYDLFVSKKIQEGFSGEELIKQKKMFFESYAIKWTNLKVSCKDYFYVRFSYLYYILFSKQKE